MALADSDNNAGVDRGCVRRRQIRWEDPLVPSQWNLSPSLLILQDNRWLPANNAANLSALRLHFPAVTRSS